jgi:FkbM family methyltransferase
MCFEQHYKKLLVERNDENILRAFGMLNDRLGGLSLALYGETTKCCAVSEVCWELGLAVSCICSTGGGGVEYNGLPVVGIEALQGEFASSIVAVCREDAAAADLAHKGLTLIPPEYSKMLMAFSVRPPLRVFNEKYLNGYSWAYDFFKDEVSRQTVVDRLRLYLCGRQMQTNTSCACYYEDGFIALGENEVFVDGGANAGESTLGFIEKMKLVNCGYTHIYAFEPDANVYPAAVKNLSNCPNVTLSPKGLWSAEMDLGFFESSATQSSSFVNMPSAASATTKVSVTSMDAVFADAPDSGLPTFIKMDIEGSEREALIGAMDIIKRKKPKMAICAYHRPEDIFDLPQTILAMRDDYRFALRQHTDGLWDTVLYAV